MPPAQNIYAFFTPSSLRLSRASRPGVTWPSCSSTSREIPQSPPRPTHPRPSARKKNIPLFVTTFPCLSRACLGKIIVLSITNGAKTREAFVAPGASLRRYPSRSPPCLRRKTRRRAPPGSGSSGSGGSSSSSSSSGSSSGTSRHGQEDRQQTGIRNAENASSS